MVSVRINGSDSDLKTEGVQKMSELIELIKSWIDPEHMITSITLNGQDLEESDWSGSLAKHNTAIVEIETGTPQGFVADRLSQASAIIRSAFYEFRDARKSFQDGDMQNGNRKLVTAVQTLQAFFEWYGTLMELIPEAERVQYDMSSQVRDISDVCKRICQQQLYQSWWALGEAIERELEPKLDKLEDFCRRFQNAV